MYSLDWSMDFRALGEFIMEEEKEREEYRKGDCWWVSFGWRVGWVGC